LIYGTLRFQVIKVTAEYIPRDPLLIFAFAQDIEMWMGYEMIGD